MLVHFWPNFNARSVVVENDVFYVRYVIGDRTLAMPVSEVDSVDGLLLPDCMEHFEGLWVCVNSRTAAFCMDVTIPDGEQLRTRLRQIPELWFDALLGAEMMLGAGPFTFQIYKAPESGR